MGDDPATSACDRFGRVHGSEHVYVADASLLNTNGSREPVRDDDGQRVARGRRARQNGLSTSCAPGCPGALAQHGFSVAACASSSG